MDLIDKVARDGKRNVNDLCVDIALLGNLDGPVAVDSMRASVCVAGGGGC